MLAKKLLLAAGLDVRRRLPAPDGLSNLIRKLRPQNIAIKLIRVGANGDGGYLIPDDLDGIEYCFSPGVSSCADFESELADRGIKSFLADYSVDSPPVDRSEYVFDKSYLGCSDTGNFVTLATWKNKYLAHYSGDLLLQMDIEGFEYQVIANVPDQLLNQFRIIVIEFHRLDRLFDSFDFSWMSACFDKLLEYFHVAHIHPNNCCGSETRSGITVPRTMEFTFINRSRVLSTTPQLSFPHQKDLDCVPSFPSLSLPPCWYSDR
jgi:hypothetical protein